jgi:hypothetical protein
VRLHTPQSPWIRPALIGLALLAFILLFRHNPTPSPLVPPRALDALAAPTVAPAEMPVRAPAGSSRPSIATTEHTRLYSSAGSYAPADVSALAVPIEETISYVHERTGWTLAGPVNVVFDRRPGACGLDAAAFTNARTLFMYACAEVPAQRAVNVLAHEVVHQLAHDRFDAAHMQADIILSEGVATWGAGRYWLGDHADFRAFVRANYRAHLLPLRTDSRGASIATMNQLYYQWASFVEWIRATQGADAFDRLYAGGTGRQPGSAPYADVLGMTLADAERAWQAWLDAP